MWEVLSGDSLLSKYARAKYFVGDKPKDKADVSPLWRSIISCWVSTGINNLYYYTFCPTNITITGH